MLVSGNGYKKECGNFWVCVHVLLQFLLKSVDFHGVISDLRVLSHPLCQREYSLYTLVSQRNRKQRLVVSAALVYRKHASTSEIVYSTKLTPMSLISKWMLSNHPYVLCGGVVDLRMSIYAVCQ